MQKIPTLFVREADNPGRVTSVVQPSCQWVLDGEGVATVKYDGSNVRILDGALWKRQKPKDGIYVDAPYVRCRREDPSDQHLFAAFDYSTTHGVHPLPDGIYEAVGPKIQAGREPWATVHQLVPVCPNNPPFHPVPSAPRTFLGLRAWLTEHEVEGLVFHHPDGRLAKIKRRDFGLSWPPARDERLAPAVVRSVRR